ncbi:MAG: hypothetical protein GX900_03605 [Clostridiaceae bacterium]|jgi:hypothetical protein|nr:hypothetical protein [Clostridiaceae bacterium]
MNWQRETKRFNLLDPEEYVPSCSLRPEMREQSDGAVETELKAEDFMIGMPIADEAEEETGENAESSADLPTEDDDDLSYTRILFGAPPRDPLLFTSNGEFRRRAIERYNNSVERIRSGSEDIATIALRRLAVQYPDFPEANLLSIVMQMLGGSTAIARQHIHSLRKYEIGEENLRELFESYAAEVETTWQRQISMKPDMLPDAGQDRVEGQLAVDNYPQRYGMPVVERGRNRPSLLTRLNPKYIKMRYKKWRDRRNLRMSGD